MSRHTRTYSPQTREHARELRRNGLTYREIAAELGGDIPKNTISSWVSDIQLTTEHKARIKEIERQAVARGQLAGGQWNREQKLTRLHDATSWAEPVAERVIQDNDALMLMVAALWLGEGEKRDNVLGFGNSNPAIIAGWLEILRRIFEIDDQKLSCQLCLTVGMPEEELKEFWSKVTKIPLNRFHKSSIDKRVSTFHRPDYKGVCKVIYYSAHLRRQIGALGWLVLDKLATIE